MVKDSLHWSVFILHGAFKSHCLTFTLSHFQKNPASHFSGTVFASHFSRAQTHSTVPLLRLLSLVGTVQAAHTNTTPPLFPQVHCFQGTQTAQLLAGGQRLVDCAIFILILCCRYSSVDD